MAYIEVVELEQSEGKLREIYEELIKTRGKLAEVHKIQSLNPDSIIHHMDLYMGIMFGQSPLKRYQREMIAVVVSVTNQCAYCQTHHGEALNHFWKDEEKLELLKKDFKKAHLTQEENVLCEYAYQLTVKPSEIEEERHIQEMKDAGWSDRAILDASLVTAYFNFVNRMVLGLGVHLEEDQGTGYKYD